MVIKIIRGSKMTLKNYLERLIKEYNQYNKKTRIWFISVILMPVLFFSILFLSLIIPSLEIFVAIPIAMSIFNLLYFIINRKIMDN